MSHEAFYDPTSEGTSVDSGLQRTRLLGLGKLSWPSVGYKFEKCLNPYENLGSIQTDFRGPNEQASLSLSGVLLYYPA